MTEQLNRYINASNAEADKQNQRLTERQAELERQKANIVEAIAKTGFQDVFTEQLSNMEQELTAIRTQLDSTAKPLTDIAITEDMVRGYLGQFKRFVKERDIPQIKAFIDSYIERVEIFQSHVKVTFKVAFSFVQARRDDAYNFCVQTSRRQLRERISA